MKIVTISDFSLPKSLMVAACKLLQEKYGATAEYVDWGPMDRRALRQRLLRLEENGPKAEPYPPELEKRIRDTDVLLVDFCPVPKKLIEKGTRLKVIGVTRSGFENIDLEYATKKGVLVLHTVGRNSDAVAEFTVGLILGLVKDIERLSTNLKRGYWPEEYQDTIELKGKTIGLIGFGTIGQAVARKLSGFEVNILATDPAVSEVEVCKINVKLVELDFLLMHSDVISLHARLTSESWKLIGEREFSLMKPNVYFINTARAGLVDEKALCKALKETRIRGAALDVFSREPLAGGHLLLDLDNVTLTPHCAGSTAEAKRRSPEILVKQLMQIIEGQRPDFAVNFEEVGLPNLS